MIDPALLETHRLVQNALERLPPADPYTLSTPEAEGSSDDYRVQATIEEICLARNPGHRPRIEMEYFGAGPLEPLLARPDVTEIIVNGADSIWFESAGLLARHDDRFLSELSLRNFVSRLSREAGFEASLDRPFGDGRWRGCRVHLAIPPVSPATALTLRRHATTPWSFESLAQARWADAGALESLRELVRRRRNFLIVGGTGSGKTSALNACLGEIPPSQRSILIEDTDELSIPNQVSGKLLTRRDVQGELREIDQSELVRQALRMRPDRLIMGEIRGGEAKDLLMAFATGHSGCMGTLHAETARQALLRLEMLVQLGAPQWNIQAVRTLIWLSLHAIVVLDKSADGARRLEGIYRIASLEDVGFLLEKT